jgi:5-formaminoimidazole-4-carboxamide-1-beta-D-ribofuranosyl 5'-monophosphate synthetase
MKELYQDILALKKYVDDRGGLDYKSKKLDLTDKDQNYLKTARAIMEKELDEDVIEKYLTDPYYNTSFYYIFQNNEIHFFVTSYDRHNNCEDLEYKCKFPADENALIQVYAIYYNSAYHYAQEEAIREITMKKMDSILSVRKLVLEKNVK